MKENHSLILQRSSAPRFTSTLQHFRNSDLFNNRLLDKGRFVGLSALLLLLTGCAEEGLAVFRPQGNAAEQINGLWWLLLGLGTLTYVIVMGIMGYGLFRRRSQTSEEGGAKNGRRLIIAGGIIFPIIILLITYGFTLSVMSELTLPGASNHLVVEVTGHQWWWEVRYPEQDIITANEIYIPAGEEVLFRLKSDDVIHSFWVPELHGKMDMIPGRTNLWQLHANEPGDYWGVCAEFCGTQHAKMLFLVTAVSPPEFQQWTEAKQQPAPPPQTEQTQTGQTIFMESGCAECHTIQGTEAVGDLGPDLTHFAGRRTLGAGAVANNRGNLAGWVADPHSIKPGSLMPAADLSGPDLQALLAYLESLE